MFGMDPCEVILNLWIEFASWDTSQLCPAQDHLERRKYLKSTASKLHQQHPPSLQTPETSRSIEIFPSCHLQGLLLHRRRTLDSSKPCTTHACLCTCRIHPTDQIYMSHGLHSSSELGRTWDDSKYPPGWPYNVFTLFFMFFMRFSQDMQYGLFLALISGGARKKSKSTRRRTKRFGLSGRICWPLGSHRTFRTELAPVKKPLGLHELGVFCT